MTLTTRATREAERAGESLRRRALGIPSARSLLFTILGEYVLPRGGIVWSSALVRALGAVGVEEKSARQAMARTAADGWLERQREGRRVAWRLTSAAESLLREGAERIYSFGEVEDDWDGRWLLVMVNIADAPRDVRHRLRTGLAWAGFGALRPGVWIATDAQRETEALHVLDDVGMTADVVSFICEFGRAGRETEIAASAWDLDDLEQRFEDFIAAFRGRRPKEPEDVFEALTQLVHAWRKFPFLDPRLPARLLPSRWSGRAAHDLFHERHAAWTDAANEWFDENSSVRDGPTTPS